MGTADLLAIGKAIELFLRHLKNQNRSPNTIIAYQGDLRQLERFLAQKGIEKVDQVKSKVLEEFKQLLAKQGYTNKSISRKLNSIKSFFKFLVEEGVLEQDPSQKISHPKLTNSLPRVLSPLEYRALRDACKDDPRTAAMVELLLQTGLRISELAQLKLEDIQGNSLLVPSPQGNSTRRVPLNEAAKKALNHWLQKRPKTKTNIIFVTKTGRPMLVRNIRSTISRFFQKAGIENATVNDLRNTFIVYQLQNGVPLEIVARVVGHKRLSTTERYLSLVETEVQPRRGFRLVEL